MSNIEPTLIPSTSTVHAPSFYQPSIRPVIISSTSQVFDMSLVMEGTEQANVSLSHVPHAKVALTVEGE